MHVQIIKRLGRLYDRIQTVAWTLHGYYCLPVVNRENSRNKGSMTCQRIHPYRGCLLRIKRTIHSEASCYISAAKIVHRNLLPIAFHNYSKFNGVADK
ncbi:hypothetical protein D3C84_932630 [compost metagenome]